MIGGFSFLFLKKHFNYLRRFSFKQFKYAYVLKKNNFNLLKKRTNLFFFSLKNKSEKKFNDFLKKYKNTFLSKVEIDVVSQLKKMGIDKNYKKTSNVEIKKKNNFEIKKLTYISYLSDSFKASCTLPINNNKSKILLENNNKCIKVEEKNNKYKDINKLDFYNFNLLKKFLINIKKIKKGSSLSKRWKYFSFFFNFKKLSKNYKKVNKIKEKKIKIIKKQIKKRKGYIFSKRLNKFVWSRFNKIAFLKKIFQYFWFRQLTFKKEKKLLSFILNLSKNTWFLNFNYFIFAQHHFYIYKYFINNLRTDNFFVNTKSMGKLSYKYLFSKLLKKYKNLTINNKKLLNLNKLIKKNNYIQNNKQLLNLKNGFINYKNYNIYNFFDLNILRKNKKKIKIFQKNKFNYYLKFSINSRWSNTLNYYRKNKFKTSLDIRLLYLDLWEVIKQKKFKLHMPFLFLTPSFTYKTFLTEKSLFLKFFFSRNLSFKFNFSNFKEFFINKLNLNKLNLNKYNLTFIKSKFLTKKFKEFLTKFKKIKFNKSLRINNKFIISSYWNLYNKSKVKLFFYNSSLLYNLNIFQFGFKRLNNNLSISKYILK